MCGSRPPNLLGTSMTLLSSFQNCTIRVSGPSWPLNIKVPTPGSKNSSMPILVAAALAGRNVTVRHVPNLADTRILLLILEKLGIAFHRRGDQVVFSGDMSNLPDGCTQAALDRALDDTFSGGKDESMAR